MSTLISVTDNVGQMTHYEHGAHRNLVRTETLNADGSPTVEPSSGYDARNRLVETRAPHLGTEDSVTSLALDANSNIVARTDPNGHEATSRYDPFIRLVDGVHREGGLTEYAYDAQDRITSVTAPNGAETRYEYDALGRRTTEHSPDRGTLSYGYDLADHLVTVTDARGITATPAYDALERVVSKAYPNERYAVEGKVEDVAYTDDTCALGLGRLCARMAATSTAAAHTRPA